MEKAYLNFVRSQSESEHGYDPVGADAFIIFLGGLLFILFFV